MDPLSHPKAEELESALGPDLELWLTLVRQPTRINGCILELDRQLQRLGETAMTWTCCSATWGIATRRDEACSPRFSGAVWI